MSCIFHLSSWLNAWFTPVDIILFAVYKSYHTVGFPHYSTVLSAVQQKVHRASGLPTEMFKDKVPTNSNGSCFHPIFSNMENWIYNKQPLRFLLFYLCSWCTLTWGCGIHLSRSISSLILPTSTFLPNPIISMAGPSISLQGSHLLLRKIQKHHWTALLWCFSWSHMKVTAVGRSENGFCLHRMDKDDLEPLPMHLKQTLLWLSCWEHPTFSFSTLLEELSRTSQSQETQPSPSLCPYFPYLPFSLGSLKLFTGLLSLLPNLNTRFSFNWTSFTVSLDHHSLITAGEG